MVVVKATEGTRGGRGNVLDEDETRGDVHDQMEYSSQLDGIFLF